MFKTETETMGCHQVKEAGGDGRRIESETRALPSLRALLGAGNSTQRGDSAKIQMRGISSHLVGGKYSESRAKVMLLKQSKLSSQLTCYLKKCQGEVFFPPLK